MSGSIGFGMLRPDNMTDAIFSATSASTIFTAQVEPVIFQIVFFRFRRRVPGQGGSSGSVLDFGWLFFTTFKTDATAKS